MSTNDEPVSDTEILSTVHETGTLWDNPDTCLHLKMLLDSKENPLVVYTRMEFFRQMVARGVYSEWEDTNGHIR